MSIATRLSPAEIVERGKALYEQGIRSVVELEHRGEIVVIDVETGHYEMDLDHLKAAERAAAGRSDAPLFAIRIGYPTLGRIGAGRRRTP